MKNSAAQLKFLLMKMQLPVEEWPDNSEMEMEMEHLRISPRNWMRMA